MTLSRADGTLTATWNAPANAAAYHVTYTTNNGQSWSLGALNHTPTTWTLSNADNAATYVVGVRARNSANDWSGWTNSAPSGPYNAPPPGAVASVNVTRANGTLTAAWDAPANAAAYHVTYTTNNGQSWSLGAMDHAPTTWTLDTADNDATYIVGVRARNSGNAWSGWVNSAAAGPYVPPVTSPPAAPTGLSATAGDGSVVLSWNDPSDASISGYELRVNHNATSTGKFSGWGAWQRIADSGAATTSHTLSGLTNGAEYRYRLRAVNAAGAGATAPNAKPWYVAATPDGAPSISVTHVTATSATLNLNNHSGAWYYQSSGGSGGTQQAGASANSSDPPDDCIGPINGQANLTHLGANTTYTITVYGGQCQGGAIASGSFNTLQGTLADPTGIQVYRGYDATQSANAQGTMDVEWGAVPNATGYKVAYTRNWHDFLGQVTVSGGSTTTAKITGFDHSTSYWVVVKATGANNAESGWGWSAISYAAMPPRPVYVMTLTRADAGLQVAWKQCNVAEDWCNSLSPVTGFQIDLSDDGGTTWTKVWEAASVTVTNYTTDTNGITTGDASATVCANTSKSYRVRIGVTNRMATAWSEASAASSTVGTYTPTPGARHTACDFDTPPAAGNRSARGIGSDGATMWVMDSEDSKIYAYDMATKARDTSKEISLDSTQDWVGIATDGVTLWAGNNDSATTIYAYSPVTGARNTAKDLSMSGSNDHAYMLWTDGGHLWVHDQGRKKIYAYDLTDNNAQDTSKTISLENKNGYRGIWSDGATMWIMENSDGKAYAYNLASRARDSAKDYSTLDGLPNLTGYGIWSDGTTLWIADQNTGKLYAYHAMDPVTLPPAAPATVNAYRGLGFVDADWTAVSGADGYNVEHFHPWNGQLLGQEWVRVASNTTATSLRVNRQNWPGDVIRVQAVKRLNAQDFTSPWAYSAPVPQVTTYPTAPGGLAAARLSANEIIVSWTQCDVTQASCNSGTPITHFHVEISTDNGNSWTRAKSLTSYTSGAPVSVTQGVTASVNRVRVGVDTRVMDAWTDVSVATVSLTASSVTDAGATLTLSGHTGGWWYQGEKLGGARGTCTSVPSGDSITLTGLDFASHYEYKAYSQANCLAANLIATERFSTRTASSGPAFSVTNVTWNTARLTLSGHTGDWWYKGGIRRQGEGPCTSGPANFVLDLVGLSGDTEYTYNAYSDSSCGTQIASIFITTQAPALTASNITATGATLTLANHAGDWWHYGTERGGLDGQCVKGDADYSVDLTGLTAGADYTYGAYSADDCDSANANLLDTVNFTTTGGGQGRSTLVAGWRLERDGAGVLRVTAKPNAAPAASAGAVATPTPGSRDAANDVTTLAAAGNTSPDGLWSERRHPVGRRYRRPHALRLRPGQQGPQPRQGRCLVAQHPPPRPGLGRHHALGVGLPGRPGVRLRRPRHGFRHRRGRHPAPRQRLAQRPVDRWRHAVGRRRQRRPPVRLRPV